MPKKDSTRDYRENEQKALSLKSNVISNKNNNNNNNDNNDNNNKNK